MVNGHQACKAVIATGIANHNHVNAMLQVFHAAAGLPPSRVKVHRLVADVWWKVISKRFPRHFLNSYFPLETEEKRART